MVIITSTQTYGIFKSIEVLEDRVMADGVAFLLDFLGDYTISEDDSLMPPPPPVQKTREELKAQRAIAVEAITVTTSTGKTFDGDEDSQQRMARAILILNANPTVLTTTWTLADNTVADVTKDELIEALTLAGVEQSKLWVI